jgi:hypothetical protein
MLRLGRIGTVVAAAVALAAMTVSLPQEAEAGGRRGSQGPVFVYRGFYGYPHFGLGPYWSPYWGAYWGPYTYRPEGGLDLNVAMLAGWGAIDLNVKPKQAEVWVDGKYVGEARDLDGHPSFLWLPEGVHRVTIYKGGHVSFDEELEVRRGQKQKLKLRLEQGASEPPGQKPEGLS